MQCPSCPDSTLSMTSREGIEIDYCPKCRGVWLDRGELDKIIERTANQPAAVAPPAATGTPAQPYRGDDYRRREVDDDYRKHGQYKKRRGLLGDLFDFD